MWIGVPRPYLLQPSLNVQHIRSRLRINSSIENPVYIDVKEDRVREEKRRHVSKVKGGYHVGRLMGTTDLPSYRRTAKTRSTLSSRHGPSGTSRVLSRYLRGHESVRSGDWISKDTESNTSYKQLPAHIHKVVWWWNNKRVERWANHGPFPIHNGERTGRDSHHRDGPNESADSEITDREWLYYV